MRRGAPSSYRYVVVDAPDDRGRNEQMFYGDYDYRFGRERMEEARKSIQQARSAKAARAARYSTHRDTVARGATLLTALFRWRWLPGRCRGPARGAVRSGSVSTTRTSA